MGSSRLYRGHEIVLSGGRIAGRGERGLAASGVEVGERPADGGEGEFVPRDFGPIE